MAKGGQRNVATKDHPTKKRKRHARRKTVELERVNYDASSQDDTDSDSSVEFIQNSASTARRILWQRGHNAMLPSTKKQIIDNVTVDSVADAHGPLCEYGFAIVRDMTEVFAPKTDARASNAISSQNVNLQQYSLHLSLHFTFNYE
jgi:hypothetical protein